MRNNLLFDDLKNVLTSNEIKMLRQHFIEGYSIKEISIANSMKIGTGTMKFSRMYKKIKIQNVRTKIFMRVLNIANKLYILFEKYSLIYSFKEKGDKMTSDNITVIMKPTNQCNLRCKYCYHADNGYDKKK